MIADKKKKEKQTNKNVHNVSTISEHTSHMASHMGDVVTGGADIISEVTKNRIVRLTQQKRASD